MHDENIRKRLNGIAEQRAQDRQDREDERVDDAERTDFEGVTATAILQLIETAKKQDKLNTIMITICEELTRRLVKLEAATGNSVGKDITDALTGAGDKDKN